jgi:hypothetical protein
LAPSLLLEIPTGLLSFFLTDIQSIRIPLLDLYLSRAAFPASFHFEYLFVNYTRTNSSEQHSITPPPYYRSLMNVSAPPQSADLSAKLLFAFRFFLQNCTLPWMFRGTDDTIINFPLLPGYIRRLEHDHNPNTEFVFRASCVSFNDTVFPQGGSGFLLSRHAVAKIEPAFPEFVTGLDGPEDLRFGAFLDNLGVSQSCYDNGAFAGQFVAGDFIEAIKARDFTQFPVCRIQNRSCFPVATPLRQLVVFHERSRAWWNALTYAKVLFAADPKFGWWMPWNSYVPQVCIFQ